MSTHRPFAVVTTIQAPTGCIETLLGALRQNDCPLIVVGDSKGPFTFPAPGSELYTLEQQLQLPFKLAPLVPTRHYTRKNLGYLLAFQRGATSIYETDDDNAPLPNWQWRSLNVQARRCAVPGWVNLYRAFSDENIWPRGLPLNLARQTMPRESLGEVVSMDAPVQQGLANGSPDVDAVWRLILDKDIVFRDEPSIVLSRNTWCPFNSQSTWWWPVAYPLMYLPSYCSFRMTDIWRSFITQRCLWELNTGIVFHAAEVVQLRNVHNLMKDFQDEVPGYLQNNQIVNWLAEAELEEGPQNVAKNLLKCYELLVAKEVFPAKELDLVRAWVEDVQACVAR